jgi:Acyl-CoA reductase (LuxC)
MNLPNYFLADLPPEAPLSPKMIAAACDTLKRNREKFLRSRPTDDLIKILCEVAAEWLSPQNKFRQLALEFGPAETGFSKPVLEKGLDGFFRRFTPENFRALLEQELGHAARLDGLAGGAMARGPQLLVHIAAGNLPNPALMSLTLGLLTRSAQFMKCASGAALLPRLFAHSLYELDPKLGACLEIAEWRGGNVDLETALFAEADCVTATGSDGVLAAIRARLPGHVRFLGYGHRVSFGFVTREVLRDETIAGIVARAADDVIAWDQNGCLSPHVFYVEERGAVESDKFAALLAAELARRETVEPRGKISVAAAATIASKRAIYEALAVHRADAKIWASENSTAWTVVFEHEVRFQPSCLNRFVFVKPVPDVAAVLRGADELQGKVSTVGLAATPEAAVSLARQFAQWGATRICPLGQMQNPPLTWRHDGRPALGDLVIWTDFEL